MNKKTDLYLSLISFWALVVVCIISAQLIVPAQGWRAGEAKTNASAPPANANKTPATASNARRLHKSARTARAKSNVASSGDRKAKSPAANATTAKTQASRERLVNHNKNAEATATNTGGVASKSEAKPEKTSAGSVRTAAATKARSGRCDPNQDERIDLSGTYSGNVSYPNAGLSGDATLTISGNRFTLRSGSKTESGNITAVTTCTYTSVAMMFGEWRLPKAGEPVPPPLPMLSLTANRKGDQLALKSSPSERREFSFAPAPKK